MKIRGQEVLEPADRIRRLSMVDGGTGCWNWIGATKGRQGYGSLIVGSRTDGSRRTVRAHRYAYEVFVGPVGSAYVCHRCDNPRCVNPAHLFLGTAKDNAHDRDRKGRTVFPPRFKGSKAPWAKLTDEDVREIRSSTVSSRKLAPRYNISDSQLRAIRRGLYYPEGAQ